MGCIYLIRNLRNDKCYIGQTIHDAEKTRIPKHFSGQGSNPLKHAIAKYGKDAFIYEILHDGIIPEFLDALEIEAIKKFNTIAPHGYNLETGGGNGSPSAETRRKQSEAKKGQSPWNKGKKLGPLPKEHRQRISDANTGKKMPERTEEHCKKISETNTGRKPSDETRQKMSEAKKGNTYSLGYEQSDEHRRKISEALTGITRSAETRRKISEGLKGHPSYKDRPAWNKGKKTPAETRRKQSEAKKGKKNPNYGKPFSEETCRKISEANTGEKHPNYGKPAHNRSPYYDCAHKLFCALPETIPLSEKREKLRERFPNVKCDTMNRWTRKWDSEI